jgi:hypothetical protein
MPSVGSTCPRLSPRLPAPGRWAAAQHRSSHSWIGQAGVQSPDPGNRRSRAVTWLAFSGSLATFLHLKRHSGAGPKGGAALGHVPLLRRP